MTRPTAATPRDRRALATAVARLDRLGPPDWRDRVDLDQLDMFSWRWCVLGQVFGDYDSGRDALYGSRSRDLGLPTDADATASGLAAFGELFPSARWVEYLTTGRAT